MKFGWSFVINRSALWNVNTHIIRMGYDIKYVQPVAVHFSKFHILMHNSTA